jgi:hypothetical protein
MTPEQLAAEKAKLAVAVAAIKESSESWAASLVTRGAHSMLGQGHGHTRCAAVRRAIAAAKRRLAVDFARLDFLENSRPEFIRDRVLSGDGGEG